MSETDNLDVFVIVHDQDLLLRGEADARYRHLRAKRFVFVGPGPTDRIAGRADVVIARDLADHIETSTHLLAFTAWYAVARNKLAEREYVAMLEYDVDVAPTFRDATVRALRAAPGVVGYVPFPLSDPLFDRATDLLREGLARAHGIVLSGIVETHLETTGLDVWTTTSNVAMSTEHLERFVDWYLPVARSCAPVGALGHVHERCIPVFCMEHGLANTCVRDVLVHEQARSHRVLLGRRDEIRERAGVRIGERRYAPRDDDPELSLVVVTRDPGPGLMRTLRTLSPAFRRDLDPARFEVVVVDDGSPAPLSRERILDRGPGVRHYYHGTASASPAEALNFGVEMARGERLGLFIDSGLMASPGLLRDALRAMDAVDRPLVCAAARVIGPHPRSDARRQAYSSECEEKLLTSVNWQQDGYCLFALSLPVEAGDSGGLEFAARFDALFCERSLFVELGGFDGRFRLPGGGLAGADFHRRACLVANATPIVLRGEATFRQLQAATGADPRSAQRALAEYAAIRGEPYAPPSVHLRPFGGDVSPPTPESAPSPDGVTAGSPRPT